MNGKTKFFLSVALTAAVGAAVAEDQMVRDKKSVEAVIVNLYSRKIGDLEYPSKGGSTSFDKVCEYLRLNFEVSLLKKDRSICGIDMPLYFRFPNLSDQDMSDLDDSKTLPKSHIISSGVKGATAVVKVKAPIGKDWKSTRIVYFLRKTNDHWRISNILAYSEWPLDTNREGGCKDVSGYYHYALPPTGPDQVEDLPPLCREALVKAYGRDGWGK